MASCLLLLQTPAATATRATTPSMTIASSSAAGLSSPGFFEATPSLKKKIKKESGRPEFDQRFGVSVGFRLRRPLSSLNLRSPRPAISALTTNSLPTSASAARDDSSAAGSWNDHVPFYSPLVKMCGITTPEDASLAAQAGACYVGMIMWPNSKRSVRSLRAAREICAAAREFGAEPVGVFVSEGAGEIERVCDAAGLSFAQLHGDGARGSVLELSKSLNTIYVMQSDAHGRLQTSLSPEEEKVIDWVLVDGLEGGSGLTFAWNKFEVPPLCTKTGWLLAGGLNPENVANAISTLRPNAVDVASGIARSDGIRKDPARISAFMQAVRASSGYTCVPV